MSLIIYNFSLIDMLWFNEFKPDKPKELQMNGSMSGVNMDAFLEQT